MNMSYKKAACLSHTQTHSSVANEILWQLTSKCAVYVVFDLSGSVETQLAVKL